MRRLSLVLILLTVGGVAWCRADETPAGASMGGSLKSLNFYAARLGAGGEDVVASADSLRLDLSGALSATLGFGFSLDQQLLWVNRPGVLSLEENHTNRRMDLETTWHEERRLGGLLQVDRLFVHGARGALQWTVGRQAIGFGRISLFSPLDVIAPFPPDVLDSDVRPGVDAARFSSYFGMAGQLGGVAVFGAESGSNSYLLTLGGNLRQVDLVALFGRLRGRSMAGIGLAGELGSVGLKGELSWYRGKTVGRAGGDLEQRFAVAALEGWYRFDGGLVLIAEYLFNGIGRDEPEEYPLVAASAPLSEGLGYLLGRHYLLLGPSYQLHPLMTASGLVIHNLSDRSSLVRPQLAFSLADNLQLDLFWALAVGEKPRLDPLTGLPNVRSEFGSAGDSGGLLLRWYF